MTHTTTDVLPDADADTTAFYLVGPSLAQGHQTRQGMPAVAGVKAECTDGTTRTLWLDHDSWEAAKRCLPDAFLPLHGARRAPRVKRSETDGCLTTRYAWTTLAGWWRHVPGWKRTA